MNLQGYFSIHYHSNLKINDYFSAIKTIGFSSSAVSLYFPFSSSRFARHHKKLVARTC